MMPLQGIIHRLRLLPYVWQSGRKKKIISLLSRGRKTFAALLVFHQKHLRPFLSYAQQGIKAAHTAFFPWQPLVGF